MYIAIKQLFNLADVVPSHHTVFVFFHQESVTNQVKLAIAGLQVILSVSVEISTKSTGVSYKLRTHLDVHGASEPLPGQSETLWL